MELFRRTLRGTVKDELPCPVRAELYGFRSADHRAIEEYSFVVTADCQTMAHTQSVVGWFKGDLNDLSFLHPNHLGVIFPGSLPEPYLHIRLTQFFPD